MTAIAEFLSNAFQGIARTGQDLIPVGRILRIRYQRIARAIVQSVQSLQQIRVKNPPEAMIDFAGDESLVKLILGPALQCLPALERWMAVLRESATESEHDWETTRYCQRRRRYSGILP